MDGAGRFGNFVLQKVLQSAAFQTAHLKQFVLGIHSYAGGFHAGYGVQNYGLITAGRLRYLILHAELFCRLFACSYAALNFTDCLYASTSAVLWRCAEACRRLQSSFKDFAKKMFAALGVTGGSSTPYVWWCLLTLCTPEDLPIELLGEEGEGTEGFEEEEDGQLISTENASKLRLQDICTPSGCSIIMSLLRFPPATVQPLNAGFKNFVRACRKCQLAVRKWKGKGIEPEVEVQ